MGGYTATAVLTALIGAATAVWQVGWQAGSRAACAARHGAPCSPTSLRGSAFGVLAAIESFGNLAASATAGALWTLVSPRAAFLYLSAWMLVSLVALSRARVS